MKKLMIILGGILLLAAGGALAWHKMYPTYVYRYKLTVKIETPEGIKSGSSVYEVQTITFPRWLTLGNSASATKFKGEAVVIELDANRKVFSLMDSSFSVLAPQIFLNANYHSVDTVSSAAVLREMKGRKKVLSDKYIPSLIAFRDEMDPSSIVGLYTTEYWGKKEQENIESLESYYGNEYRLVDAVIEITDEPITKRIRHILPWLSTHKGSFDNNNENNLIRSMGTPNMLIDEVQ